MSSTSIQNLLDSMQTLLKHQEGAVDQFSFAASEARQGNETKSRLAKWQDVQA